MSEPFAPPRPDGADRLVGTTSAFLPVLILGLVMLAWFVFQSAQLRAERDALLAAMTSQEQPLQESKKLRDALNAIVRGTTQLAEGGNPNAKLIVDELKKRGVSYDPNAGTPATPAPAASK